MALRQIDSLAEDAIREWAARRSITESPMLAGWEWRGTRPWGRPYSAVLQEWETKGRGRPPAFQDGRARPEQLLPGTPGAAGAVWAGTVPKGGSVQLGQPVLEGETDWTFWLLRSGRGWGKTEVGGRAVIEWARKGISPILIAGATALDVRASMVEGPGESALMKICPTDFYPHYESSKRKLTFPNGVECQLLSAEEPERFRGVQFVKAWCDEVANWTLLDECWRQIRYVMRVKRAKTRIQLVLTTTPRSNPLMRQLSADPRCALTVRSSYDNMANLADEYRDLIAADEGTRFGRQEIYGEILDDIEGAQWTEASIDRSRLTRLEFDELVAERWASSTLRQGQLPEEQERGPRALDRQVVAVDPPGGRTECGLVVGGFWQGCPWNRPRCPGHFFVLEDATVGEQPGPERWAPAVARTFHAWACDKVVAEANYGGDMVRHTISTEDPNVPVEMVTATRGKRVRAEPIANLWAGEHPRGHLVGRWPQLEQEMTTFVPDQGHLSPNRMDAMVWAGTALALGKPRPQFGPSDMPRVSTWR
jgi:phage terminase large subunit-like protein